MKPYAQRCAELEAAERKKEPYKSWGPGAFMPPQLAEPETAAERMALDLVRARYPRAISIPIESVVNMLADALSLREMK